MSDTRGEFREAMRQAGLETKEPLLADGRLHRIQIEGDTPGKKNAWYVLHDGRPAAGAFGCWKRGLSEKWCASSKGIDLNTEERAEWQRQLAERKKQQAEDEDRRRGRARVKAEADWKRAKPADPHHPYLRKKAVAPYGLRQIGDRLLVPVRSADGQMRGLQRISPGGEKLFLIGTQAKGGYFSIGKPGSGRDVVILAEGFATGATIHAATGLPVAICFSAGNLRPVAEGLRKKLGSQCQMVIAADDDRATPGNPGVTAANDAAAAVKGLVALPEHEPGSDGGDFNDMAIVRGLSAVKESIAAVLRKARGVWPLHDLIAEKFPNPKWIIKKILPPGLALLVGAPKAGKSRLATNLALSVGNGGSAMGCYKARKAGVLYLDLEQSAARSQARFKALLTDHVVPQNIVVAHDWPLIGEGALRLINEHLDRHEGVQLVIVDTLAKIWSAVGGKRGGNAYHQEYALLSSIKRIADERSITIMLIHHESKFDGSDRIYKTSGTNAMTGVPDTLWMLARPRGQAGAELYVTGRDVQDLTIPLHFAPELGTWAAIIDPDGLDDLDHIADDAAASLEPSGQAANGKLEFPN